MEEATQDIVAVQLPKIKQLMASGDLQVDNIDVFCEKGVFDLNSTRCILQSGKDMGLNINFHGDELHPMNSAHVCYVCTLTHSFKWCCSYIIFVFQSNSLGQNLAL